MAEILYTLQWATLSPKIAHSHGGSGPHVTDDSLIHSEPTIQIGITIGSAFSHR